MFDYTDEIGVELCIRLAEGESLKSICNDAHLPSKSTVLKWAVDPEHPISDRYARAREIGYLLLADEIIDISNTPLEGQKTKTGPNGTEITTGDMLEHRKLQIDSRKWIISKMLPKIYGDKLEVKQQIGFTEEFERFVRELRGIDPPKVVNGLATASRALEVQPQSLRAGSDLPVDGGDMDPMGSGDAKTG